MPIQQITIIGTGLIGGSFGLALKSRSHLPRIVGCDRAEVLGRASQMGAIDQGCADPIQACLGSQVVVLALPVGGIIDMLERLGPELSPEILLTDVGSTKVEIVMRAKAIFGKAIGDRFLPGHPMAGKELSGIDQADANLFRGASWLFTPIQGSPDLGPAQMSLAEEFKEQVRSVGATAITMSPERHDELCAWISHLPQMVSTAMAGVLMDFKQSFSDRANPDLDFSKIGGRALREMTRTASSPYSMWRDIAFTNTANIEEALLQLEHRLAYIRENLKTPELRAEFENARNIAPQKLDQ